VVFGLCGRYRVGGKKSLRNQSKRERESKLHAGIISVSPRRNVRLLFGRRGRCADIAGGKPVVGEVGGNGAREASDVHSAEVKY
jgi:hypothetical protein